jgi:hypothetical protein
MLCAWHIELVVPWHESNKIMCDFFHRGVVPCRLAESEREPEHTAPMSQ